jgi:hypothetical protein
MLSGDMIDLVAASWIISIFLLASRQNALAFAGCPFRSINSLGYHILFSKVFFLNKIKFLKINYFLIFCNIFKNKFENTF